LDSKTADNIPHPDQSVAVPAASKSDVYLLGRKPDIKAAVDLQQRYVPLHAKLRPTIFPKILSNSSNARFSIS
jgi:hypothetical protein